MKTISLKSLSPGEQFIIPSIKEMKNLIVLRPSDCSVLVSSSGSREYFAPSTQVEPTGITHKVKMSKSGIPELIRDEDTAEQKSTIKILGAGRRTRNKITAFEWPKGEFSIKDLASKLEVDYHVVSNAFNREKNKFKLVRKISIEGKRGKPSCVWELK